MRYSGQTIYGFSIPFNSEPLCIWYWQQESERAPAFLFRSGTSAWRNTVSAEQRKYNFYFFADKSCNAYKNHRFILSITIGFYLFYCCKTQLSNFVLQLKKIQITLGVWLRPQNRMKGLSLYCYWFLSGIRKVKLRDFKLKMKLIHSFKPFYFVVLSRDGNKNLYRSNQDQQIVC
jgi:hypothetical protein